MADELDKQQFDHVRLKLNGQGVGEVWVNGQPLKSSIGCVIVKTHAGLPPEVTIKMYALVDGDFEAIVNHVALEDNA